MKIKQVIPILRIFDQKKAEEFYVDFLEFRKDWEHRFGDNFPVYFQVSKDNIIIHLSENHGDCTPGSSVRIEMDNVKHYQKLLISKGYKFAKPGFQKTDWNTIEMFITDPFGNRLIFYSEMDN